MSANNNCTLIGRLGRDIEVTTTNNGKQIAKSSLAVDRPGRDQNGNRQTDWFNVKLFGKNAETASQYLRKGSKVAIIGAVNVEEWTDKDGQKQKAVVIVGDGFQMLDPRDDGQQAPQRSAPPPSAPPRADDDIPPW